MTVRVVLIEDPPRVKPIRRPLTLGAPPAATAMIEGVSRASEAAMGRGLHP